MIIIFFFSGYLCIYSNFNKRKWGKRWCLVRDNTFECYRRKESTVCELDFLLRYCKLRRAITETKSELGLMLVEKAGEKITIEVSHDYYKYILYQQD